VGRHAGQGVSFLVGVVSVGIVVAVLVVHDALRHGFQHVWADHGRGFDGDAQDVYVVVVALVQQFDFVGDVEAPIGGGLSFLHRVVQQHRDVGALHVCHAALAIGKGFARTEMCKGGVFGQGKQRWPEETFQRRGGRGSPGVLRGVAQQTNDGVDQRFKAAQGKDAGGHEKVPSGFGGQDGGRSAGGGVGRSLVLKAGQKLRDACTFHRMQGDVNWAWWVGVKWVRVLKWVAALVWAALVFVEVVWAKLVEDCF
jgi:hypothetical protein